MLSAVPLLEHGNEPDTIVRDESRTCTRECL